jgi:hypothetical protein
MRPHIAKHRLSLNGSSIFTGEIVASTIEAEEAHQMELRRWLSIYKRPEAIYMSG